MLDNFVDFRPENFRSSALFPEYEDQLTSESQLTEAQLTARQVKLRELYKGRRPVPALGKSSSDPGSGIRNNFWNRFKKNTPPRRSKSPGNVTASSTSSSTASPGKLLELTPSGQAVTVVKPPPDFKPSEPESESVTTQRSESPTSEDKVVKKTKPRSSPFDWSKQKQQKQRAALATSIIGSRLKDLKEKRKLLMNTSLVTERREETAGKQMEARVEEVAGEGPAQVVKVRIEEKSSEVTAAAPPAVLFPTKKRRFKPQIKPTAVSQKWSIKDKLKNKNKLQKLSVKKDKTKGKQVNKENEKNPHKDAEKIEPDEQKNIENKSTEVISEELLDKVYGELAGLQDKLEHIKQSSGEEAGEQQPPLKKIAVEESAAPISVVPHGVPIKRGFLGPEARDEPSRRVLVLPAPAPAPATKTKAPAVTQFLQFLPYTTSTLSPSSTASTTTTTASTTTTVTTTTTTTTTVTLPPQERQDEEIAAEKRTIVEEVSQVAEEEVHLGLLAGELAELESEEKMETADKVKMTADLINANIEKVLKIQMPKHTKLLYGDNRQERDPASSIHEVDIKINK